jgi:hypothetical protein
MNTQELINKIKSKGYWRVEIRPTKFEKLRIPTLGEVQKIVQSCVVSLRGWDYPHWNQDTVQNIGDWVESWVDWEYFIEYWRFYQSGQFIHHFALHEDHMNMEKVLPIHYPPRPKRAGYLGFVSATYQVTEIFEFAARLANKDMLSPRAFISVSLHNIKDHQLATWGGRRFLEDSFVYSADTPIVIEREIPEQELVAKPDEFALDYVINIFEHFQWNNPPRQVLGEDQKKLRERRL